MCVYNEGHKVHVIAQVPDNDCRGDGVEGVLGDQGDEEFTDLVMELGSQGYFSDSSAGSNTELPFFAEKILEKGAILLAPSRDVNPADRGINGDRPLFRSY